LAKKPYKNSVKKIVYFNAMMDPALGEVFKGGILKAHQKHSRFRDFEIETVNFFYNEKASPREMSRYVRDSKAFGVILSGSEKNTSDGQDPWVKDYVAGLRGLLNLSTTDEDSWLGPSVPIFGICFGHQALVLALGGELSRFSYRSGFVDVIPRRQALNNPVFSKILANSKTAALRIGVTHGDHVVRLPKGLHLLATSQYCDCQAIAHDQWPILGVQSHPEITEAIREVPGEEEWKNEKPEDFKTQAGPQILDQVFNWMMRSTNLSQ
jgi:GMP synthase-like glutamine amidotransferase